MMREMASTPPSPMRATMRPAERRQIQNSRPSSAKTMIGVTAVSYTQLDVYKRQGIDHAGFPELLAGLKQCLRL